MKKKNQQQQQQQPQQHCTSYRLTVLVEHAYTLNVKYALVQSFLSFFLSFFSFFFFFFFFFNLSDCGEIDLLNLRLLQYCT